MLEMDSTASGGGSGGGSAAAAAGLLSSPPPRLDLFTTRNTSESSTLTTAQQQQRQSQWTLGVPSTTDRDHPQGDGPGDTASSIAASGLPGESEACFRLRPYRSSPKENYTSPKIVLHFLTMLVQLSFLLVLPQWFYLNRLHIIC